MDNTSRIDFSQVKTVIFKEYLALIICHSVFKGVTFKEKFRQDTCIN